MNKKVLVLCESGIMLALATALSLVKILELPYGGSVTAFSIVPLVVISYRHGIKIGILTGFAYSVIQLLLGTSNLSYATSIVAAVAIIMLDYIFAFTFIGLAGIFRKIIKNQITAVVTGTVAVCAIRYIFHVISGCTVWAGVSIPSTDGLLYSLSYNATYMIPETVINTAFVFWLFLSLDFGNGRIKRADKKDRSIMSVVFSSVAVLAASITVITDAVCVFASLQNPESGELDFSLITNVDFTFVIAVTLIGLADSIIFAVLSKAFSKIKSDK